MRKENEIIHLLEKKSIELLLEKGERVDGRKNFEFREISIKTNVIEKAEGSALVRLGNTMVIAGVKMNIGRPYPDTPNKGNLIVNTELIPIASPVFEPGPPGEDDIEISRVVDRGIRSAEAIDLEKLAIIPGQKVWVVFVDIYALNHDGNLMDAAMLAAISALLTTKKPVVEVQGEEIKVLGEVEPLPMKDRPVSMTFGKIGKSLIVDPNYREEHMLDARLTITISEKDKIVAIQKGLPGGFTLSLIHI